MAYISDVSIGIGVESGGYGTAATPTRWAPLLPGDESLNYTPNIIQSQGLIGGGRKLKSAVHRTRAGGAGDGAFSFEMATSGMGLLMRQIIGAATSTLVSGSTYQQVITLGEPQYTSTLQKRVVRDDGVVVPQTYRGCVAKSLELSVGPDAVLTGKADWDAKDMTKSIGATAPSYAAAAMPYHFAQGTLAMGGTVTPPTATALASGGTAVTNVRDFAMTLDQAVGEPRKVFGGQNRPKLGRPSITGTMNVEYTDDEIMDAVLADEGMDLLLTFTSEQPLTTGFATLQLVFSEIHVAAPMPQASGDLPVIPVTFEALDDLVAAEGFWMVLRTADTAL